jgi:hypothetical protein
VLAPLVRHCPSELHAAVLGPLLAPLLEHFHARLCGGYAAMAARAAGEAGGGGEEKDGIVADQAVRVQGLLQVTA